MAAKSTPTNQVLISAPTRLGLSGFWQSTSVRDRGPPVGTEGKEDFISEAGEEFDENRWPDAFGWFSLDLTCSKCGKESRELFSYETM